MLLEPTRLASYIASKICHDLVSPLGAGGSALDLLEDSSAEMREQAQLLLVSGTQRGLARLQFLRYAFGSMGLSNGSADMHEARALIDGYVGTHTATIEWDMQSESLTFAQVRLLMNIVMLGLTCLSGHGVLHIKVRNAGKLEIILDAKGKRAKLAADVKAALARTEPEDGWNPRTIQPYFATMILDEMGGSLKCEASDQQVRFVASDV